MIVMKFGGTSVGSAERIRSLADRVRERQAQRPVVVVSALSGVTDQLIRGARLALAHDPAVESVVPELRARHEQAVRELLPEGPARDRVLSHVAACAEELRVVYTGVHYLEDLTARSMDAISAMGERLSAEIVAAALQELGLPAEAVDARRLLVTDDAFGRAVPDMEATAARIREGLVPRVEAGRTPVLGGFIGATPKGVTTTLGRGGSDWSAAIFGALLPAREIQIWTDVDGMMTLDPRVFPRARVIPEVSFDEAAELAYFGAKVLHPATIKPAVERGIPVRILNSLNPAAPGTRITRDAPGEAGEPRAIAFKKGISVLQVSQPRMLMAHGFLARVFEVFARHRTPVDLIATSEVSISLTVDQPDALAAIRQDLEALGDVRILPGNAIVSVVGRGFLRRPGLASRIFSALRDVNVLMISFGASDVNLSCVVAEADAERAVRSLHHEFFAEAAA
jgi:aspartate kinase